MKKGCLWLVLIPLALIAGVLIFFFFQNQVWFAQSANESSLTESEHALFQEAFHLRTTLGNSLWSGWGNADLPMITYNEDYAFLMNLENPTDGWYKVPSMVHYGTVWQVVEHDEFNGQPYYRQALEEQTPEAFTVLVGERWTSSLTTKDWFRLLFSNQMREELPGLVAEIFPYKLFVGQLLSSSDHYISLILHESFHAFQGTVNAKRLADAEIISNFEDEYPREATADQWKTELKILSEGMNCPDQVACAEAAREFMAVRDARRAGITGDMIEFERQREWLEGLAKYTELKIWQLAGESETYQPFELMGKDDDFDAYQKHASYWKREQKQTARMANQESESLFYYSGMVQAVWLDQLMPDWKNRIFEDGIFLEDLLAAAVEN